MPHRRPGAVTIEEVARAAGLSRGTASRVNPGSGPVPHQARTQVEVMSTLRRRGRRLPGDVSVTGFDDNWHATLSVPPLTTGTHPVAAIASAAVAWALDPAPAAERSLYASELVLRESA